MLALAAELRAAYRITFGCIPGGPGAALLDRASDLGVEILPLDGRGYRRDPEILRLQAWLRREQVDLFHLHAGVGWEGHTATHAAREAGTPVVVRTEHLPDVIEDPEERASYELLFPVVDRLICVSGGVAESLRRAGAPRACLCIIRNGITPRLPLHRLPAEMRHALDIQARTPVALTVARFTEQKGHRLLLEAIPSILSRCPDVTFLWAGDGPLGEELRRDVKSAGLDRRVRFLGQRRDVPEILEAADLMILPSIFEGLPLVALEAMAAGLPVIGTRVCGTSEVIVDRVTGRLVEPGDAAGLAEAVIEAVSSPGRARQWGAAGRHRVEREFTAARMARETAALYEELLDLAPSAGA
jgi:glycosyltransferase involved in cell wall biosynthesis